MLSGGEGNQTRPTDVPHKAKAEAKHWLEYAIFIFVIATAVATGAAAYYTRQQWLTAEDQERRSLRAYISAKIEKYPDIMHDSWDMIVVFKNHGQTPALNVSTWIQAILGQNPLPSETIQQTEESWRSVNTQDATLFPGEEFRTASLRDRDEYRLVPPLTDQEKVAIRDGWKTIWLLGEVRYTDVFNVHHTTPFRLFMTGEYMAQMNKLFWAPEGNYAD